MYTKHHTVTSSSPQIPSIGIIVYGVLGAGIIAGLLSEKLVVRDFTEFKLASLFAYFDSMRISIAKFVENPDEHPANMRDLLIFVGAVLFLLAYFVYGVYKTNSLFSALISTVFMSAPVIFFIYLVQLAFSSRPLMTTTSMPTV